MKGNNSSRAAGKTVKEANGKVFLKLNRRFYPLRILRKTAKDFSSLCGAEIKEKGNYFHLTLVPRQREKKNKIFAYEFCNYALSLKQKGVSQ